MKAVLKALTNSMITADLHIGTDQQKGLVY
jgi:hypothetical protein